MPTPTVTLFCGLPGAGKTTLAKRLEADGHGVRICTDDWKDELGIAPTDLAFHERLQVVLYRHALALLRQGVDVILEDGLWRREERTQKFADVRAAGARIEWHVFDVPLQVLWSRLERRNAAREAGAYPMSRAELRQSWSVFEPPGREELAAVDEYRIHRGALDS